MLGRTNVRFQYDSRAKRRERQIDPFLLWPKIAQLDIIRFGGSDEARLASFWPIAIIGLSLAATVLWVGILALLVRAFISAI
jgi:hypothetical protein